MAHDLLVDAETLRAEVRDKYRAVAMEPAERYHFHTGRPLAARLGYDPDVVDAVPEAAVESFAGVGNPFSLCQLRPGERVVDVRIGEPVDTFGGAGGEPNARAYEVLGYAFVATRPAG